MNIYTLKGEAGKSFGEVEIPFDEMAESGALNFGNAEVDRLTFEIVPGFLDARDRSLPEEGQMVSLSINGKREFHGVVTRVDGDWNESGLGVSVEVSGPWWWLQETGLSSLLEIEGKEVERPQFRCPKGNVRDHIIGLLERAKTLGVPVEVGEIAECYECPTTTFRDGSFSYALAELMRLVPDSVGWWDYSGTGDPKFNLSRRDVAGAQTLMVGSDELTGCRLTPELSLKVESVDVKSARREDDGTVSFESSTAGGTAGRRQIVTVSGPDLLETPPVDPIDGVTVSTVDLNPVSGVFDADNFRELWPWWQDWIARHPGNSLDAISLLKWVDNATYPNSAYNGLEPLAYYEDGAVLDLNTHNKWAIVYEPDFQVPSWLSDVVSVQKGYVRGSFRVFRADTPGADPDWLVELLQGAKFVSTVTGGPDNGDRHLFFDVDVPVTLLDADLTDFDFFKPLGYFYEEPPADYAENLFKAQNWLPFSGSLSLLEERFTRRSGQTVNVAGGLPQWESAGTLVQGESFDLESEVLTLNVGVAAVRSDATSVTRLERNPADSLVRL